MSIGKCFILVTLDELQEVQSQHFFKASFTEADQADKLKILKALGKKNCENLQDFLNGVHHVEIMLGPWLNLFLSSLAPPSVKNNNARTISSTYIPIIVVN